MIDSRLKMLHEEKQNYESEFVDRSADNFDIDMSKSFFNQIKELIHQRSFKTLVRQIKARTKE